MERLVEIRELKGKVADLETEIHELLEENERLRKAGNALARAAEQSAYHKEDYNVIKAWLAAKGVQS
jgi:predicted  nucleic acid-binding Zn-ribbon protein